MSRMVFPSIVAAMLVISIGVGFIVPLLPVYAQTMGATGIWVGLIFGANPLVRAVFDLLFGRVADARGMKRFMLVGLAGYAVVALGFLVSRNPLQLFLSRSLQGVFGSMVFPITQAYAGSLTPQGKEGTIMSFLNLSFFSGLAIGPILGGVLKDHLGLAAPFIGMALLSLTAFAFVCIFVPELKQTRKSRGDIVTPITTLLKDSIVQSILCARVFISLARGVFTSLIPIWGSVYLGFSASTMGSIVSLRFIVEALAQPVFGPAADRVNRQRMVLSGFILAPLALYMIPSTTEVWHLFAVSALLALNGGICVPAITAISTERGREFGMGSMMGVTGTAMDLGMASGAFLGGAIMDLTGIGTSFFMAALSTLLGMAGFAYLTWGRGNSSGRSLALDGRNCHGKP